MSDLNPCLSEDIWFEIFKQLAVKTLGKCRCVCKSWRSLVVSPSFMAAHLKHYTRNQANSLILCKQVSNLETKEEYFEECIFFRDLVQLKLGNKLHTSVCPFVLPNQIIPSFHLVGSVHGLLCVSDLSDSCPTDRILLWNPLIQNSIKLSQSTLTSKYSALGFGYDYRRNDHRVIKIGLLGKGTALVEVYSVYSVQERTWRIICARYLVDNSINWVSSSHCFLNGVIHWFSSQPMSLLLFNVSEETFMKMKLPEELVKSCRVESIDFGLFEYQGKLSVSLCGKLPTSLNININSANFDIWVKRDYNVESSWCKIICVEYPKFYHNGPIEYLGEDEELIGFSSPGRGQSVSYDPKTEEITELGPCFGCLSKFSAYSESLVLLDQKIDDLTADELERFSCQFA